MIINSKYIALKEYIPSGNPELFHFSLNSEDIKLEKDKDVLIKNEWISVDPYMRARMTERKNYKPPFKLEEPMEGAAIGKVLDSNSSNYSVGDVVVSEYGWRDHYIAEESKLLKIEPITKTKIYEALTFLSYQQDLFILEKDKQNMSLKEDYKDKYILD